MHPLTKQAKDAALVEAWAKVDVTVPIVHKGHGWQIVRSEQEGTYEHRQTGRLYNATRVEWLVIDDAGTLRETFTLKRDARDYLSKMSPTNSR